jgi:hypothetical protein
MTANQRTPGGHHQTTVIYVYYFYYGFSNETRTINLMHRRRCNDSIRHTSPIVIRAAVTILCGKTLVHVLKDFLMYDGICLLQRTWSSLRFPSFEFLSAVLSLVATWPVELRLNAMPLRASQRLHVHSRDRKVGSHASVLPSAYMSVETINTREMMVGKPDAVSCALSGK